MSVYQSFYDLITEYIFGGGTLSANADLIATAIASVGVVFLVAMPFILVYKVICLICG